MSMKKISKTTTALALSQFSLAFNENQDGHNKEVPSIEIDKLNSENQQVPSGRALDSNMDPKKLKRVLASRQYSQKYRLKQMQYILQLETEVKALHAEVAITAPRIKYVIRQNTLLRVENGAMKQKLTSYSGELMFKEAQYEELKKERDVMKQFYAINHLQFSEFFNTISPGNYPSMNSNLNQPRYNPYIEHITGTPQTIMDENSNQFGSTGQDDNLNQALN